MQRKLHLTKGQKIKLLAYCSVFLLHPSSKFIPLYILCDNSSFSYLSIVSMVLSFCFRQYCRWKVLSPSSQGLLGGLLVGGPLIQLFSQKTCCISDLVMLVVIITFHRRINPGRPHTLIVYPNLPLQSSLFPCHGDCLIYEALV